MRALILAAGAGGMYCGSCMHDNRLAAALRARGHDAILLPLYTPLKTDERDVSDRHVYYGGINTYLQQHSALFRHTPRWLDRLLDARWLLRLAGRMASNTRAETLGPMTLSVLRGAHGAQRKELDGLIDGIRHWKPDLVQLPNLLFLGTARRLRETLNVPIICELTGEDIFVDQLPEPFRGQVCDEIRGRAADVDGFVALTRYYADYAARRFNLPPDRITHLPMGIPTAEFAASAETNSSPEASDQPFTIGYLARLCPEKGVDELCETYLEIRRQRSNCRLRIAGYLGAADRPFFDAVLAKMRAAGCGPNEVEHVGEVSLAEKIAFLQSLQVMSVPTRYAEAKGFYVLEALAAGVPVVLPRHGSFPEFIEATRGGVLYEPDNRAAHARAIIDLIDQPDLRRSLAAAGQAAVRELYDTSRTSESTWQYYEQFVRSPRIE